MKKIQSSKKSRNILLKIALCVFVAYIVFMLVDLQAQIKEKQAELDNTQTMTDLKKRENDRIRKSIETDDEKYIEQVAREKFGLGNPGDTIFVDVFGK